MPDPVAGDSVRLDLRQPPSPAELGVSPDSDTTSVFRSSGRTMLDVDIRFPGGGRLRIPAIAYHAVIAPGGASVQDNEIVVNRVEASLDAAVAVLSADADLLGLDRAEIQSFADRVEQADLSRSKVMNRVLRGHNLGYLTVETEIRVRAYALTVLINYMFNWAPAPAASPPVPWS
jgi:hypothetical protein